jgi:hypothetical protein
MNCPEKILSFRKQLGRCLMVGTDVLTKCGEIQTTSADHSVSQIFAESAFPREQLNPGPACIKAAHVVHEIIRWFTTDDAAHS